MINFQVIRVLFLHKNRAWQWWSKKGKKVSLTAKMNWCLFRSRHRGQKQKDRNIFSDGAVEELGLQKVFFLQKSQWVMREKWSWFTFEDCNTRRPKRTWVAEDSDDNQQDNDHLRSVRCAHLRPPQWVTYRNVPSGRQAKNVSVKNTPQPLFRCCKVDFL